jgi:hypothetical protein
MNALGAYLALTGAQKRLLRGKTVSGRYEARELVALLQPLAAFDASAGRLRKGLVLAASVGAIATIVGLVAGLPLPLVVIVALVSAGCLAFYLRLRAIDVSDNLWKVAVPFLAVIREDMPAGGQLDVTLDLTRATAKRKFSEERPSYQLGPYRAVDRIFLDPWFEGRAELADRSRLHWTVEDRIVVSKRRKTVGRKTKFKTKYRKRSSLRVDVALPEKAYDVAPAGAAPAGAALTVTPGERRTTISLARVVKQASMEPIDLGALVDLVAEAYRRAAPARKGADA